MSCVVGIDPPDVALDAACCWVFGVRFNDAEDT